jgi:murein DD-endopeptidase MepM/ murein hydrolase activator NlpD
MTVFPLPGWTGSIIPHWGQSGLRGGSDLLAPAGTRVVAMQGGTAKSQWDNLGGNTVLIHGSDGLDYYYAHLLHPANVNGPVSTGQNIGQVGNTGDASGGPTHLHIGIGHGISTSNTKVADSGLGIGFDAVSMLQNLFRGGTGVSQQSVTTTPQTTTAPSGNTSKTIPFPELVFAAIIVGAGIYYAYTIDSRAGWGLALLVILGIAFGYPQFQTELTQILASIQTVTPGNTNTLPTINPGNVISNT